MKNRKVGNDLLARGDLKADRTVLSELAEWLSELLPRMSCYPVCLHVWVWEPSPMGMDSISQVSSTSHLGTELENRAQWQSCPILPETCQHVLMSCHTVWCPGSLDACPCCDLYYL